MSELFESWEINREPIWPRVTKLLAGSVILHAGIVAAVFLVPTVREAIFIADMFTGAEYVDREYEKTRIGDRAVMLANERFQYPPGYFAAERPAATPQKFPEARVVSTPETKPTPEPAPSSTPEPSPEATAETPAVPEAPEDASRELDRIAAENNIERPNENAINKRPLNDWLAHVNDLKTKGELDLGGMVDMVIVAERDEGGKLRQPAIVQKSGDPKLIELARELIAAINDSNALVFLKESKQFRFSVRLDQQNFVARIESEAVSPDRAKQLASSYNVMLLGGQVIKRGKTEEILYKHAKVSSEGRQIILNFQMTRQLATDLVKKQLGNAGSM